MSRIWRDMTHSYVWYDSSIRRVRGQWCMWKHTSRLNVTNTTSRLNVTNTTSRLNFTNTTSRLNVTNTTSRLNVTNTTSRLNVTNTTSHLNVTNTTSHLNVTNTTSHLNVTNTTSHPNVTCEVTQTCPLVPYVWTNKQVCVTVLVTFGWLVDTWLPISTGLMCQRVIQGECVRDI